MIDDRMPRRVLLLDVAEADADAEAVSFQAVG
jgi:hypothetical protein